MMTNIKPPFWKSVKNKFDELALVVNVRGIMARKNYYQLAYNHFHRKKIYIKSLSRSLISELL